MTSPRFQISKSFATALAGFTALFLFSPELKADAPPPPTTTTPPAAPSTASEKTPRTEALNFLHITRIRKICEKPITFSVQEATVDDVALRIEKLLQKSELKPKFRIEVRQAQPIRLTFSAKKAPIGDILTSTADLAGVKLWMFSDYLLLAPEKALLPSEQSVLGDGRAMETNGQFDESEGLFSTKQTRAFLDFIGNEVKGFKPVSGPQTTNSSHLSPTEKFSEIAQMSKHTLVGNTSFSQLSPNAQEMLQELFGPAMDTFLEQPPPPFLPPSQVPKVALAPDTPIAVLAGRDDQLVMFFGGKDMMKVHTNWSINGTGGGWSVEFPMPKAPPTSPKPAPAPPFDPSAGKS